MTRCCKLVWCWVLGRGGGDVEIAKFIFCEKTVRSCTVLYLVRKDVDTLAITSFPKDKIRVLTETCYFFTYTTPV